MSARQHAPTVSWYLLGLLIAGLSGGAAGFVAGLVLGVVSR
jgi:hypothetical protein